MYKSRVVCFFLRSQSEQPIIYRLVKDFDLVINILKADINPRKERLPGC
jgi:ABC-type methionine transport system ATPase subunit